jgi:hypothetical protein
MKNTNNITSLEKNKNIYALGNSSSIVDLCVSPFDYTIYIDNKRSFTAQFFSLIKDIDLGVSGSFSILEETEEKESYLGKIIQLTIKISPVNNVPRILFDGKVLVKTESFSISVDDIVLSRIYSFIIAE